MAAAEVVQQGVPSVSCRQDRGPSVSVASASSTKVSSRVAGTRRRSAATRRASSAARTRASSRPATRSVRPCRATGRPASARTPKTVAQPAPAAPARQPRPRRPARVADDGRLAAFGDDTAGGHDHEPVALGRLLEIVRRDEHAGAARRRLVDRVPETGASLRVDARGGLVEDEQLGRVGQGRREGEPAPEAERQVAHEIVPRRLELGVERRRGGAEGRRREGQVLGDAQVVPQAEALRDVAEPPPRRARRRRPEEQRLAFGGRQQPEQHADHGRLAGPVGAEQSDDLAAAHREVGARRRRRRRRSGA